MRILFFLGKYTTLNETKATVKKAKLFHTTFFLKMLVKSLLSALKDKSKRPRKRIAQRKIYSSFMFHLLTYSANKAIDLFYSKLAKTI